MTTTHSVTIAASNSDQLRAWDGGEGEYWAEHADRFDGAVAEHHRRLLATAAITPAELVLDIGCGTGETTRDAARAASAGTALGVDLSSRMLDHARRRAADEGLANVSFLHADAQIHRFVPGSYDVAISRTGAMWFGDPVAAFANIARALRPNGRLVLVTWQALAANEWMSEISSALGRDRPTPPPDAPGPFSLADADRIRSILATAGLTDVNLEALEAPMRFGADPEDAQRFVIGLLGWMLDELDDARRARAVDDLRSTMERHATPDGVVLGSAAWTITATRS